MMNTKPEKIIVKLTQEAVLNTEINAAIASKITPTTPAPEVATRLKTKLMQGVQANAQQFVFAHEGEWKTIDKGVQVKLLHHNGEAKSFLLKMDMHSSLPAHVHMFDEESFVLAGEVYLQGILCHAGDYHYAQAGSAHQAIHSAKGCTLLVKSVT